MKSRNVAEAVENLDRRLEHVEQILPTLATKKDLEPLATKDELREAVAKLATKDELREEGERSRTYMKVLVESVRGDLRLYAERLETLDRRDSRQHADTIKALTALDGRVTALEAYPRKRRT